MGVRTWFDEEQIDLNKTLQTARDDCMIVGMTLPRLSELDSQMRGRLHAFLEMTDVEPGEWAEFKWKNLSPTRDETDQLYKYYPRMRVNGRKQKVTRLKIGPPPEEVIVPYEEKKQEFKADLYASTLETMGDEGEEAEESPKDIAAEIKDSGEIESVTSIHGGWNKSYIDSDKIRMEYDLTHTDAKLVKKLLEEDEEVAIEDE